MISETRKYFSDHKELSNTSKNFKYFFMAVTYAVYYTHKMQARHHIIKVVCLIEHTCFFAYAFRMKQLMNKKCPPKPVQQIQEHGLV